MADGAPGVLYVVATPIGNLEDLSPRAARVLAEVDRIAAEDTRRTVNLLRHLGIEKPVTSYYDAVESRKAPALVEEILGGRNLALVSDAGTPLVSDPGYRLVRAAIEAGIRVVPIPGPTALATLLAVSGLPCERFVFEGFLPAKPGKRRKRLEALRDETRTIVVYESPHHVLRTLAEIEEILGDRAVVVGRELTKLHEEIVRGRVAEVRARLEGKPTRGEYALAIGGAEEDDDEVDSPSTGASRRPLPEGER
jgi:16S rRNA (cytidine1402-2'-O)-methyltransferase